MQHLRVISLRHKFTYVARYVRDGLRTVGCAPYLGYLSLASHFLGRSARITDPCQTIAAVLRESHLPDGDLEDDKREQTRYRHGERERKRDTELNVFDLCDFLAISSSLYL